MRGRYKPGDSWDLKGFRVWIEDGRKSANDVRVMLSAPVGGGPVPVAIAALVLDMLFEAEDIARERPQYAGQKHFRGWRKMSDFCQDLWRRGPDPALERLYMENPMELPLFSDGAERSEMKANQPESATSAPWTAQV